VDLDLPSGDRREALIQHVYEKFTPRGAAMTANVICYRGRSAMREMGKVLGIPEDTLGRFSDLFANGDFPNTLGLSDHLEKAGLPRQHPRLAALNRLYNGVHGLPRHLGQHSGGMIISDRPLDDVVPLENASMPGRVVVQWDKDDCEDLGIIKVDLLGLGMMAVVQDTIELCERRGRPVPWETLANDADDEVFDMMERADTVGVFQIESRAQMATLPRMKPRSFYDVAIQVAIIRPGPIVGNLANPFLERRAGRQPVEYMHPDVEPVLKRTLGVPLFQEQMLKIAMVLADFNGAEAEELRRAMSFHRSEARMVKVTAKLYAAMEKKGVERQVQDKVVEAIRSFALYGFPESHAISFALIAYGSTWLKVHRTAEFFAGLLNNQPMGFYSSSSLIFDAKRHGLRVRPVCARDSGAICEVLDDRVIRLGLNQVKGLSLAACERLLAQRARLPFTNLTDFLVRVRPDRDERRVLAQTGALNALLPQDRRHRREALWQVENDVDPDDLFSYAEQKVASAGLPERTGDLQIADSGSDFRNPPESSEISASGQSAIRNPQSTILSPMSASERLEMDYQGLGVTTGPHPMSLIRAELPDVCRAVEVGKRRHGERITIAGMVICRQRPGTAKGHVFVSLEDETGIANAFVESETFERNRLTITQEPFLRITGGLQNLHGVLSVYATDIAPLPYRATLGTQSYDFH
jgi:error-prone DNA polymerase